jgi:MFS family permease
MGMKELANDEKKEKGLLGSIIFPLALAQFVCSYAASTMNVSISNIAHDLGTTVQGVQVAITFFTLTMAALMISGSKLTDIWGRKRLLMIGLIIYAAGGLIASLAPVLGVLVFGYSFLEGLGSAFLIPPVYILVTTSYTGVTRARNFGIISAAAGVGSAAGPLIGGIITTGISWRASFILQVLIVLAIIFLSRRIKEPKMEGPKHHFDIGSAALSATGLLLIIIGLQTTSNYGWLTATKSLTIGHTVLFPEGSISPFLVISGIGILLNIAFYYSIRHRERIGKEPLLHTYILHNRTSNLGLVTQMVQWTAIQGGFFVISVFLQTVRGFNAIDTGLILTAATVGTLLTSSIAGRLAKRRSQRLLIRGGFIVTILGLVLLLLLASATSRIINFIPGLFLVGAGIGIMLTSSVNVVQTAFPDKDQGEISGLSRSISNLGSSFGVSIVGSVLVTSTLPKNEPFGLALIVMILIVIVGLVAAILIPGKPAQQKQQEPKMAAR